MSVVFMLDAVVCGHTLRHFGSHGSIVEGSSHLGRYSVPLDFSS